MSKSAGRFSLLSAWVIALIAMLITLYGSEIENLVVCHLCWYQRIAIYPLTVILLIALFRDDLRIGIYTIPLAIIGACFAAYQYLIQMIPNFGPINFCSKGPDCSNIHLKLFGFITYPFLSLIASIAIFVLLIFAYLGSRQD